MRIAGSVAFVAAVAASADAMASPYVVLQDDGSIEASKLDTLSDEKKMEAKVLELYAAAGQPLPEVLSVWTTFPLGGEIYGTLFDPIGNTVDNIGVPLQTSKQPPLLSILFHNDVTQMDKRAGIVDAPVDGYAQYLFLLELSHNWGPALSLPGPKPSELTGFPYHWSFWMDAGGSPAGGNGWKDNGDGTFTTLPQTPAGVHYSKVDQYIMGLVPAADIPPFGVLEAPVPPGDLVDPLWGGPIAAHTFPWFAPDPITVTATRVAFTSDDLVSKNGAREPAAGTAQTSWTLGIVLLVSAKDGQAEIDTARGIFDPIAEGLAPGFHTATDQLGTLEVVTSDEMGTGGVGGGGGAGGTGVGGGAVGATSGGAKASGARPTDDAGCGCRLTATESEGGLGALPLGLLAALVVRRRRRPESARG